MREELLHLERISYWEQGASQLEDFNLTIYAGEIMGLLPVRGHGLTALIDLLQQNLPLRYGYVYYKEELLNTWRSPAVHPNRIGVIHSTSSLVEGLTVADNIFVLRAGFRTFLIRPALLRRQLQPFFDELSVDIRADSYVEELTTFQRFVVELLKAVVSGCRLIILRDIGTFLSESELAMLHTILKHYADRGMGFLYIGFHFEELSLICNRTALLVNGRITKVLERGQAPQGCSDRYIEQVRKQLHQQEMQQKPPVFQVENLWGGLVQALSFSAMAGECLVLQDLDNHIFDSLLALILGTSAVEQGEIYLGGTPFLPTSDRRIAIIRQDPINSMLFGSMSYLDNLCFTLDHRLPEIWRSHRVQDGIKKAYASQVDKALFQKLPQNLNRQQKYDLIYRRILLQSPKVVFCVQPFKGADMELRMHIWTLLQSLMDKGIAVVILAVNLSDSLALASSLIRIHHDGTSEIYHRSEFSDIPLHAPWINIHRDFKQGF